MPLHPTMKRRLHERLHPLIGDEEADALLDAIPDDPITKEWLRGELDERFERIDERFERIDERFERIDERFERIDERFERIDERFTLQEQRFVTTEWAEDRFVTKDYLDAKLEGQDFKMEGLEHRLGSRISELEGAMHQAFREQTRWVYGAAAFFAAVISILDRVWG